ncbi:Glutamate receptor 3.1, partial [Frankliniella fusca]
SLHRAYSRWPLSRYLLVLALPRPPAPGAVDLVFSTVWTMTSHLNVALVSWSSECARCADVHAYWPFHPRCNDSSGLLVGRWRLGAGLHLWGDLLQGAGQRRVGAFPLEAGPQGARALRQLRLAGCPLRVGFLNFPGYVTSAARDMSYRIWNVGADLLDVCQRRINFTSQLLLATHPKGWDFGLVDHAAEGGIDLALIPGAFDSNLTKRNVSMPVAYKQWCYTWAVPAAFGLRPALYWRLTAEFGLYTWALLAGSLLVASLVATALLTLASTLRDDGVAAARRGHLAICKDEKEAQMWHSSKSVDSQSYTAKPSSSVARKVCKNRTNTPRQTDGVASALVASTLVGLPTRQPHGDALRVFLVFWLYVGIVLTTAYTAALHSLVAAPVGLRPVSTPEELADSPIPVGCYPHPMLHLRGIAAFSPTYAKLYRRVQVLPYMFLEDYLANATLAAIDRRDWLVSLAIDPSGRHRGLHVMHQHCMSTASVFPFLLRRGSPLEPALRHAVLLTGQVGLLTRWERGDIDVLRRYSLEQRPMAKLKPLGMRQMSPIFFVYAAFLALAIGVLVIELHHQGRSREQPLVRPSESIEIR